jgi:hypothetical protein
MPASGSIFSSSLIGSISSLRILMYFCFLAFFLSIWYEPGPGAAATVALGAEVNLQFPEPNMGG